MKTKTLFIGTGEFAVPVLEKLFSLPDFEVVGIVTQPDRPVGRKQELKGGPVKQWVVEVEKQKTKNIKQKLQRQEAEDSVIEIPDQVRESTQSSESGTQTPDPGSRLPAVASAQAGIPVYQPEKLRLDADEILASTMPDLIIVAAYGQMIPQSMLDYPKYGALNLHGSLLPVLRGAVPVPMAILQGMTTTGVTIQRMVMELDAGAILAQTEVAIATDETTATLMTKLAAAGADLLAETLPKWVAGEIEPTEQDHDQATFCYQADIAKEKAEITFETPVEMAERMVRAFDPWPIAFAIIPGSGVRGPRLKVFAAKKSEVKRQMSDDNGVLSLFTEDKRLFLNLRDGVLELLEVQLEGKSRLPAKEYLYLVG